MNRTDKMCVFSGKVEVGIVFECPFVSFYHQIDDI